MTVVVCNYAMSRWDDLVHSLESVWSQAGPPADVLVVVDNADDVLTRLRAEFPGVKAMPNESTRGLSGARNTALAHVGTPLVVFLDDDAAARQDWLINLLAPYADPQVLGVGGRLVPNWDTRRPAWFPEEFDWVVGCTHRGARVDAGPIRNPIGANMSFRTKTISGAGGFKETLGRVGTQPLGCEETEACIRIAQTNPGGVFWFAPDAVVDHRVRAERAQWAYFRTRCVAEGWSKAHVRALSDDRLNTERTYATRVLPRSVARDLKGGAAGESGALSRAAASVGGLGLTAFGYAAGRLAWSRRPKQEEGELS